MITLFQFHRSWDLPNASSFCMKLETYLRMTHTPYENKFVTNPQKSPKNKLPHIKMDGITYSDSELIIDDLKARLGDPLDKNLTQQQKSMAVLIEATCCERLYWYSVYMRWQDDEGWEYVRKTMFEKLPRIPKLFLPGMVRKYMLKQLSCQGTGRHSFEEIKQLGIKNLNAMSEILADKPYFLGDNPTSIDATAFSFLTNIIWTPLNDPIKKHGLSLPNITAYCNRMWDEYYPDLIKPKII